MNQEPAVREFPKLGFSAVYEKHLSLIHLKPYPNIQYPQPFEAAWDIESSRCPAFIRKAFGLL